MHVIQARSVTHALVQGLNYLAAEGERSESRNGPVVVAPTPVTTVTVNPVNRVLFMPGRGDNPFFHLVESLLMLAGRRDLAPLKEIVKQIGVYSDDGGRTQPGAYGYRWRKWFGDVADDGDQLRWAIRRLKADPNDRRVVVSMWDAWSDPNAADKGSADVPCNTQLYLLVRGGRLDMTVLCRSNDRLWGAHGANAVHFSVLQEYLAAQIGVKLGFLYQVSNNYHLYVNKADPALFEMAREFSLTDDPYFNTPPSAAAYPLFDADQPVQAWDEDLEMWWRDPSKTGLRHSFFRRVATPVLYAHKAFRDKSAGDARFQTAFEVIDQCAATDWKARCRSWFAHQQRSAA